MGFDPHEYAKDAGALFDPHAYAADTPDGPPSGTLGPAGGMNEPGAPKYVPFPLRMALNSMVDRPVSDDSIQQVSDPFTSAAGGVAAGAVEDAGASVSKRVADYIENMASRRAFKALGPIKSAAKKAALSGSDVAVGRQLLDEGAVPWLGTPKRIAERVEPLRADAGQEIGRIIDRGEGQGLKLDMKDIANKAMASQSYQDLEDQYGTDAARAALDKYLGRLGSKGEVGLRQAQQIRQGVDKGINFGKRVDELAPAQTVLYDTRSRIRDGMNTAANQLPGEQRDALLSANRRYGGLEMASDILEGRIAGDMANRSIGLTDTISGAAGYARHGAPGAALAAATNKAARTFGDSVGARGLDLISGIVRGSPESLGKWAPILTEAASRGPSALATADRVLRMTDPAYQEHMDILAKTGERAPGGSR